jgi:hypothetical protein
MAKIQYEYDEDVLGLMDKTIAVWEAKLGQRDLERVELGTLSCPLCQQFYDRLMSTCGDCPVRNVTERHCCVGTPYTHAPPALWRARVLVPHEEAAIRRLDWEEVATAEIEFLKDVRQHVADRLKEEKCEI